MPLNISTPGRNDYNPLLEKLERKMEGWMGNFLSRAGKLQLIKSVLSSIPIYHMSCFKFPKWLNERIEKIMRQFLWSKTGNNRGVHLINWQTVCLPVICGGMGVVNIELQNMAMLLRWLWRLYADDRKLWATYAAMLHAVRPVQGGPIILSNAGSFFWRALLKLMPIFHSSATFRLVSGKRVSFWFDRWLQQTMASTVTGVIPSRGISLADAKHRVHQLLPAPLTQYQHQASQALANFSSQQGIDCLSWLLTASGEFSVRSIYKILSEGGKETSAAAWVWRMSVTPSMRCFLFLLLKNKILTQEIMQRRNIAFQPGCVMCDGTQMETAVHLFLTCSYANRVWRDLSSQMGGTVFNTHDSIEACLRKCLNTRGDLFEMNLSITALWLLWKERNERIFRQKRSPFFVLVNRIRHDAKVYYQHCSRAKHRK